MLCNAQKISKTSYGRFLLRLKIIQVPFSINIIEGDRNCEKEALKTTPHFSFGGNLDDF